MKLLIVAISFIVGASCQIYTQIGEDGYKYPRPQARFNLPEPIAAEPACSNGGSGQFCCTNGAENVDCCTNGGSGPDCCTNGGSGPFCCSNGATNADCCENGGKGTYCCTNGANNPSYEIPTTRSPTTLPPPPPPPTTTPQPTLPPLPSFFPLSSLPQVIPIPQEEVVQELDERIDDENIIVDAPEPFVIPQTPPPLPAFVPQINLPKVIPVQPIISSSPAPFQPAPLPVKPLPLEPAPLPVKPLPQIQPRTFGSTTKSPNEYLPPFDVRSDIIDWESWKAKYNKRYASIEEDEMRRSIFDDNVKMIVSHKNEFEAGIIAYEVDVNKFCDLKTHEFLELNTGLKRDQRSAAAGHSTMNVFMPSPLLDMMVEDEVDWRKKGAVTPVKNQGSCASCWAFAANGALEAQNFLATGKLVSLSEQNLIDCVKDNDGCDGGYMTNAYEYVRRNPGVDTENSYPYEERNATCRFDPANVGATCMAHMEIMIGNERALMQAVATVGPVAAGIDGSQRSFQFYKSGYYFEPKCDTEVNHALLIVGYGKTEQGEEYWIGKNSWDTDWGEEGYIRMARNKNNHCGITSLASYPLV